MPITAKTEKLVSILADGRFHSGQDIGEILSLSRGGVWKLVQSLDFLGLDVFAIPGKGYRLSHPIELLEPNRILSILDNDSKKNLTKLVSKMLVDSTNDQLKKEAQHTATHGNILLAEFQTQGRGRRGRQWVAPFASSICMSALWRFDEGFSRFNGLSIVVALSILDALHGLGADNIQLKWPNDLMYQGGKLAGILIELGTDQLGQPYAIVGLGLNVNLGRSSYAGIDQAFSDVYRLGLEGVSRNLLVARMLNELFKNMQLFVKHGLALFIERWQALDYLKGHVVDVQHAEKIISGVVQGVDDNGALIVTTDQGQQKFYSGDVSVRKVGP